MSDLGRHYEILGVVQGASPEEIKQAYTGIPLQSERSRTGAWTWEYGNHDGLMLAADHTNAEGRRIHMGDVAVFSEVDDAYFTDAAKSLDGLK